MVDLTERKMEIRRRHDAIMSKVKQQVSSSAIARGATVIPAEDNAELRANRRSERLERISENGDLLSRRSLGQRKVDLTDVVEDSPFPSLRRARRNSIKISTHDHLLDELEKLFTAVKSTSKGVVSEEHNLSVFAALAKFQGSSIQDKNALSGKSNPVVASTLVREAVKKIESKKHDGSVPPEAIVAGSGHHMMSSVADHVVNHYPRRSFMK